MNAAIASPKIASTGLLGRAAILYIAWSLMAATVAIARDLPAEFAGFTSQLSVTEEFVYGMGTALSPPLYWLAVLAILVALLGRADVWGKVAAGGLALSGLVTAIGAAGEPITLRALAPATFDPMLVAIQAGMILIPVAMAVLGWRELRRRGSRGRTPGMRL